MKTGVFKTFCSWRGCGKRRFGTDCQEETLFLSLSLPGDAAFAQIWNASYYDGSLGDQAWLGGLTADSLFLAAFSKATNISILTSGKELIYQFPAKGTATGAERIQDIYKIGAS